MIGEARDLNTIIPAGTAYPAGGGVDTEYTYDRPRRPGDRRRMSPYDPGCASPVYLQNAPNPKGTDFSVSVFTLCEYYRLSICGVNTSACGTSELGVSLGDLVGEVNLSGNRVVSGDD